MFIKPERRDCKLFKHNHKYLIPPKRSLNPFSLNPFSLNPFKEFLLFLRIYTPKAYLLFVINMALYIIILGKKQDNMKLKKNKNDKPALYGLHAVREAWLNDSRTVYALYITPQAARSFEKTLLEGKNNGLRRPRPIMVEKSKLDRMLPKGAVHQGVALACSPLEEIDERDLVILLHQKKRVMVAMLDQVTDPHNVGAILRSAAAFGVNGVVMQKKHAPELNGVLAKTACGAVDHIPVAKATNLSRAIEEFQAAGFIAVGLDERGKNTIDNIRGATNNISPKSNNLMIDPLDIAPPPFGDHDKILLILGSEGNGIRHLVKEKCDALVRLPTKGTISSLNVSNAAAVAFYVISTSKNY